MYNFLGGKVPLVSIRSLSYINKINIADVFEQWLNVCIFIDHSSRHKSIDT